MLCLALGLGCNNGPSSASPPRSPNGSGPASSAVAPRYPRALIEGVPHVAQKPDFCGEADVEMYTAALGQRVDQDQVFAASGMDPARGMGATTRELKTALERLGFEVGPVWSRVPADDAERGLEAEFAALHADLARGVPSIVCMHFDDRPRTTEHFRLVLGYEPEADEVVYHDPAVADGAYLRMKRGTFLALWPLKYGADEWTVIRFPLAAKTVAAPGRAAGRGPADYAQHVMELRKKLPSGFSVVVEPPFVVVGDGGVDTVRRSAERTVRWAVELLQKDFFPAEPREILDIWLFQDAASYRKGCVELFDGEPTTPYGFYSSEHKALVMNIGTGGGTLVHEIVHPFVEANFPEAPAWLNEGLGSLYEQASSRDGHIIGLTNWRLAGLQEALRAGRVPSFAELTATTRSAFYGDDRGTNYAQARYLLYYLQEKGLLVDFYRRFAAARATDPTGYQTLAAVLGESDMAAFQKRWEAFVLGLRFP
ncbi:MAG: C39 family peptidase [Myxococcales bacterium]|nr:C39 family peptidase [Myxococcales bacterium]